MLKEEFKKRLIEQGYSTITPSGNPSTVDDYVRRVETIIKNENLGSWEKLADNITFYLQEYDKGGCKEHIGKKSHNAIICALRAFYEFLKYKRYK